MGNRLVIILIAVVSSIQICYSKPGDRTNPATVEGQSINFAGNKVIRYSRVISNNTSSTIAFGINAMPQNDSDFIARYLLSQVTNPRDTEATKLEIIKALVSYFKSPYFSNGSLLFGAADTPALAKQCSPIGMTYSFFSAQCGNYVREVQTIAVETGYFSTSDFQTLNLSVHIVGQVMINGYYCLFDPDPSTNGGMFPYSGSPNGYAKMKDVRNDSTLIVPYLYNGQQLPGIHMSLSDYRSLLVNSALTYQDPDLIIPPLSVDGNFKIPAGGSITANAPAVFYFLDTTNNYTRFVLTNIMPVLFDPNSGLSGIARHDSFINVMKVIFDTDSSTVSGLADTSSNGIPILYNSVNDQGLKISALINSTDYSDDSIPSWAFSFATDSVTAGVDIQAPLLVVSTSNSCNLIDSVVNGPGNFELWGRAASPVCNAREVNFLQQGTFYGPGSITCAVNIGLIDPLADWVLNGDSAGNLVIENKATVLNLKQTPTQIISLTDSNTFDVYPNPAVNQVVVPHSCSLFNAAGKHIMNLNEGVNDIHLASGTYIVTDGVNSKTLLIQ